MFNSFIQILILLLGLCLAVDGAFGLFFPGQVRKLIDKMGGEAASMFQGVKPSTMRAIALAECLCGLWLLFLFAVGQDWMSLWK